MEVRGTRESLQHCQLKMGTTNWQHLGLQEAVERLKRNDPKLVALRIIVTGDGFSCGHAWYLLATESDLFILYRKSEMGILTDLRWCKSHVLDSLSSLDYILSKSARTLIPASMRGLAGPLSCHLPAIVVPMALLLLITCHVCFSRYDFWHWAPGGGRPRLGPRGLQDPREAKHWKSGALKLLPCNTNFPLTRTSHNPQPSLGCLVV